MVRSGITWFYMNNDGDKYDLNLLRGWQRSQLELLNEFAIQKLITQSRISGASGLRQGSHELGGKITALTRAGLIEKAGRDEGGQVVWQLNEKMTDRDKLLEFLKSIDVSSGLAEYKAKKVKK